MDFNSLVHPLISSGFGSNIYLLTDEKNVCMLSCFKGPEGEEYAGKGERYGAHQPWEGYRGTNLYVAWFAGGLRVVYIEDPKLPVEIDTFEPVPALGRQAAASNDVYLDERGLIYLIDRYNGMYILE